MASRLDRITDWEDLALKARYRVNAMARLLKVSRQTLSSHLTETFGFNARFWVQNLRLRRAEELLLQHMACKEIAYELGMTPSSMCRLFQRTVGCTPESYQLTSSTEDHPELTGRQSNLTSTCITPQLRQIAVVWLD